MKNINWVNTLFLLGTHILGIIGIFYLLNGFLFDASAGTTHTKTLALGIIMYIFCGLSMTAGYHRLYSHKAYRCGKFVELFFLAFGSASVQNSILKWSCDHRFHHEYVDTDKDPYNIKKGFWWAHIGWIFYESKNPDFDDQRFADLMKNPLVRFQHQYYTLLAVLFGGLLPMAFGALWGDPIGGLLVGGFTRLMIQYHCVFSINSFTHTFGKQPYTVKNSSRDSWWVALITFGEGYHNYHHRFPRDWRNGIHWWQFDQSKWVIWILKIIGLARGLVSIPKEKIYAARMAVIQQLDGEISAQNSS